MAAGLENNPKILSEVERVYSWLASEIAARPESAGNCRTCGRCCDFNSFAHRLFVTTPEIIYFRAKLPDDNIRSFDSGRCPYNLKGKCTVYKYRFAGCRIFCCCGDSDFQSRLSEKAIGRFKSLCRQLRIPYRYMDLPTAMNNLHSC